MAGKPRTRARLAREAAAASRKPVNPALKREALRLADEVGPAEAARRTGVKASTIRMWRTRATKDASNAPTAPSRSSSRSSPTRAPAAARADELWRDADRARERARDAEDRGDKWLSRGKASEARNATVVATQRGERARQLEDDARAQELHEVELAKARGEQVIERVSMMFAALGLTLPARIAELVLRGEEIPADTAERARLAAARELGASAPCEAPAMPDLGSDVDECEDQADRADADTEEEPADAEAPHEAPAFAGAMEHERRDLSWRGPLTRAPSRWAAFNHPGLGGGR